jgi:excisionase family DNA binding protein
MRARSAVHSSFEGQVITGARAQTRFHWAPGRTALFSRTERTGQTWTCWVPPNGYVTQQQAAALLGVSVVRVNKLVRAGRLRSSKIGGVSMIPLGRVASRWRDDS